MTSKAATVALCIPAYQAEDFIDRTLWCARNQTHDELVIAVSVDRSTDATEAICRRHALDDPRVVVTAHTDQLGWVGNVNHLLDTAVGEFASVYFHDDLIEPTYVERLVGALAGNPNAASAHCDVVLDHPTTGEARLREGFHYRGTAVDRLLAYLVAPQRGELLRSLVRRTGPAGNVRMPSAAALYEMRLVVAGDAVRVAEPLYRRIVDRPQGMTTGWNQRPFDEVLRGVQGNVDAARRLVGEVARTPGERELLELGLAVYFSRRLRRLEQANGTDRVVALNEVGLSGGLELPESATVLPPELLELCATSVERVTRWTAGRQREVDAQ